MRLAQTSLWPALAGRVENYGWRTQPARLNWTMAIKESCSRYKPRDPLMDIFRAKPCLGKGTGAFLLVFTFVTHGDLPSLMLET